MVTGPSEMGGSPDPMKVAIDEQVATPEAEEGADTARRRGISDSAESAFEPSATGTSETLRHPILGPIGDRPDEIVSRCGKAPPGRGTA